MKRGPNKIKNCYLIKDMYAEYISDKPFISPYYVSYEEYCNICADYFKWIVSQMIDKSKSVKLPFRLGDLYVAKKKPAILSGSKMPDGSDPIMNSLSVDWSESKKFGKWIRHINDHTGGYKYRFIWSKIACSVVNKNFYRLVFTRTNKRHLAKMIKSKEQDYVEM